VKKNNRATPHEHETWVSPTSLLTPNRFDLGVKLLYLRHPNLDFARAAYEEDLSILTQRTFREPDHSEKSCFEDYEARFLQLRELVANGQGGHLPPVLLAEDGTLLNGAHRVAAAVHSESPRVLALHTDRPPLRITQQFYSRSGLNLSKQALYPLGVLPYLKNPKIVVVWPKAHESLGVIEARFGSPLAAFSIKASSEFLMVLIAVLYEDQPWLNKGARVPAIYEKARQVEDSRAPVNFILIEAGQENLFLAEKDRLRQELGLKYSSFHTTDDLTEAIRVLSLLACEDLDLLMHFSKSKLEETKRMARKVLKLCEAASFDAEKVAVDGSAILQLHQIRPARDIDLVALRPSSHAAVRTESEMAKLNLRPEDVLLDPNRHFRLFGVKFLTLRQVMREKHSRNEAKDSTDVLLIQSYLKDVLSTQGFRRSACLKSQAFHFAFRFTLACARLLRSCGLGKVVDGLNFLVFDPGRRKSAREERSRMSK